MKRFAITGLAGLIMTFNTFAADLELPDPLTANDGTAITTKEQWEFTRRAEIMELFREHVYGRRPAGFSDSRTGNSMPPFVKNQRRIITDQTGLLGGKARAEHVRITYDAPNGPGEVTLTVVYPADVKEPFSLPAFLLICHRDPENLDLKPDNTFWPWRDIVNRGYVAAAFWTGNVDPDNHDEFKDGIHGQFDQHEGVRPGDAWATISAWGWGASLCMDYLSANKWIDASKVAVIGHSRGGKTALWAGAEDTRFALVISNDSGCTGAAISRRREGERLVQINDNFPHWFNGNYKKYNEREHELPVDQHMLTSLIAPRLLYVASASEDSWADPPGEFMSTSLARQVYSLYGYEGLGDAEFPEPDQPIHGDHVAYHLRTGGHGLERYDWHQYMDFADKHWK